jgi:hypothetical protein
MKTPKIGDIVIFHPNIDDKECRQNQAEIVPAIVVAVWSEDTVNLNCIPDCGTALIPRTSVIFKDNWRGEHYYWTWPE